MMVKSGWYSLRCTNFFISNCTSWSFNSSIIGLESRTSWVYKISMVQQLWNFGAKKLWYSKDVRRLTHFLWNIKSKLLLIVESCIICKVQELNNLWSTFGNLFCCSMLNLNGIFQKYKKCRKVGSSFYFFKYSYFLNTISRNSLSSCCFSNRSKSSFDFY